MLSASCALRTRVDLSNDRPALTAHTRNALHAALSAETEHSSGHRFRGDARQYNTGFVCVKSRARDISRTQKAYRGGVRATGSKRVVVVGGGGFDFNY